MIRNSIMAETFHSLKHNKTAIFGLVLVFVLIFTGLFAPVIAPYDPYQADLDISLQPPSAQHWMGTDEEGRDVLSRIVFGARISLKVGIIASTLSLLIGVIFGLLAGFSKAGWIR